MLWIEQTLWLSAVIFVLHIDGAQQMNTEDCEIKGTQS